MTTSPPIMEFPCPCTVEELLRANGANNLEWTKQMPTHIIEWRPLGDDQPLWPATIARAICEGVLDARKRRNFRLEKQALHIIPTIPARWGKRRPDEDAVGYIRRHIIKVCTRWMRATDPKQAGRAERDRRADRELFGSRRPDLFSGEAKKDIIRLPDRDRHRRS